VFVFGGVSGALFNPALTLALWTARKISALTGVLYIAVQMLGAWGAYYLYTYFVKSSLQPIGGHFTSRILVAEAVGSLILGLGIAAALYQAYTRAVSATVYGLAYTLGILAASSAAIGLLNPALALGVRSWVWGTYVLGPVLGAVIGVNLFGLLFATPEALVATTGVATARPAVAAKKPAATKRPARKATSRNRK
jgi:glycerol uptake facilitator-like aquaporin